MKKRMTAFSLIPLSVCLLASFLPVSYAVADMYGYDLTFYRYGAAVLILTAELTAMLAALVFSKRKLNKFGEVCASLMPLTAALCAAALLLLSTEWDWTAIAGLWLMGWTAAAFYRCVVWKRLKVTAGIIGGLMAVLSILLMLLGQVLEIEPIDLTSADGRGRAQYVSSISPDGSEIEEAYFSNGMPHLRVRENNNGIDLKIARLNKQPMYIRFGGSGAIERIEWKDENTLWIDNEAAYSIPR